jgi:hypothetical protein
MASMHATTTEKVLDAHNRSSEQTTKNLDQLHLFQLPPIRQQMAKPYAASSCTSDTWRSNSAHCSPLNPPIISQEPTQMAQAPPLPLGTTCHRSSSISILPCSQATYHSNRRKPTRICWNIRLETHRREKHHTIPTIGTSRRTPRNW